MLESPELASHTHLLTVSFDPVQDTPSVLRKYGLTYVGETPGQGFRHWEFTVPPNQNELQRMARFFGLTYAADSGLITHSLSTTMIGPDGRVLRWYHGGDWKPDDIIADATQALRQPADQAANRSH
jgi:protein SCO1/2